MFILDYVHVENTGVLLEGRVWKNDSEFDVRVLVTRAGVISGKITDTQKRDEPKPMERSECMRAINSLRPPKIAVKRYSMVDTDMSLFPYLHTWFVKTLGYGCHVYTPVDETTTIAYA